MTIRDLIDQILELDAWLLMLILFAAGLIPGLRDWKRRSSKKNRE